MANILASHPDVYIPLYETGMFLHDDAVAEAALSKHWAEAERQGRTTFAEKTPRHIHRLESIRRLVDAPLFIMPVRDGRDVAASIEKRFNDLQAGIDRWIDENRIVLDAIGAPDVMHYRYEDFVTDPAGTVERVCAFTGLRYDDALLDYHRQQRLWFGQTEIRKGSGLDGEEHVALRNWQANQPIFDGRGRWRSKWTDRDFLTLTEGRGRHLMQAFGYI